MVEWGCWGVRGLGFVCGGEGSHLRARGHVSVITRSRLTRSGGHKIRWSWGHGAAGSCTPYAMAVRTPYLISVPGFA
eukprot:507049-Rhodomonas_salina.1